MIVIYFVAVFVFGYALGSTPQDKKSNIAEVVSDNSPYTAEEVNVVMYGCDSVDSTLAAVEYGQRNGYSNLQRAYIAMQREYPGRSAQWIYSKYGSRFVEMMNKK
jgi:hypothetical protein